MILDLIENFVWNKERNQYENFSCFLFYEVINNRGKLARLKSWRRIFCSGDGNACNGTGMRENVEIMGEGERGSKAMWSANVEFDESE
jgi:hypothetical protein